MKKIALIPLIIACLFAGSSCNNSGLHTKAVTDSAVSSTDSGVDDNSATVKKPESKCCFVSLDEVKQFFPAGDANIKPSGDDVSGNLICTDDAETPSNVSKAYTAGNEKFLLRINDFCVNPHRVELDYDRRYKTTLGLYSKDQQVQDIGSPNSMYKGFAIYSATDKNSYLQVVVDGRFSITIAGTNQSNINDIQTLFSMVPIDQLVAFKK